MCPMCTLERRQSDGREFSSKRNSTPIAWDGPNSVDLYHSDLKTPDELQDGTSIPWGFHEVDVTA